MTTESPSCEADQEVVLAAARDDYLHVARCGDEVRIVNVLWQRRPVR